MLFRYGQERIFTALAQRKLNSFRMPMRRNARMGRLEAVQRDTPGLAVMFQCSAEERLRRGNVPGAAEVGFYGPAVFINRSVQVHPSATDQNVGLVAAP